VILVAAPSPSVDVTYLLDRLEPHAIHRPREVVKVPGGKALNAARVAAALGATVRVVAALGGPTGEWIATELGRRGIPARVIVTAEPTRTCVSIAHDGGLTEVYEPATPLLGPEWTAFAAALADDTVRPQWTVMAGSLPRGAPADGAARIVTGARAIGSRTCVDTSGPALAAALAAQPDLVKVNAAEAAELLGAPADADPLDLARALHERSGATAVVTAGVHGAAAWSGHSGQTVGPPARRGAYPVGSGDAFLAGLVVALDAGHDLAAALGAAATAAAANAAVPGAGELSPSAR
jgi:1-phosphofructokinase family hexose kinase